MNDLFSNAEEVRILVVKKDKNFRHDLDDPRRDYKVVRMNWSQAFAGEVYALRKSRDNWCFLAVDEKQNIIAQAWMRNGEICFCSDETLSDMLNKSINF